MGHLLNGFIRTGDALGQDAHLFFGEKRLVKRLPNLVDQQLLLAVQSALVDLF